MQKCRTLVAATLISSVLMSTVGEVAAASLPEGALPSAPAAAVRVEPAAPPAEPAIDARQIQRGAIRDSLDALRQSPPVLLPSRVEKTKTASMQQTSGGGGLGTAAKAAIWLSAVTVAGVWAYKTFSVTRGTD